MPTELEDRPAESTLSTRACREWKSGFAIDEINLEESCGDYRYISCSSDIPRSSPATLTKEGKDHPQVNNLQ